MLQKILAEHKIFATKKSLKFREYAIAQIIFAHF